MLGQESGGCGETFLYWLLVARARTLRLGPFWNSLWAVGLGEPHCSWPFHVPSPLQKSLIDGRKVVTEIYGRAMPPLQD